MGLFGNFLMKRAKQLVPGVNMNLLKSYDGFDKAWMEDPQFRDLLACAAQLSKTDFDVSRMGSRGYMKRIGGTKMTLKDKSIKRLFDALEVETDRLDEDGYIAKVVGGLIEAKAAAKNQGEHGMYDNTQQAVNVCCMALAQHILASHPDYIDRIVAIAPALKEAVN